MKKHFLILAVALVSFSVSAQVMSEGTTQVNDLMLRQLSNNSLSGKGDVDANIKGSQFMSEEFVEGEIITTRGTFNAIKMRYNIYQDAIQFDTGSQYLYLDASPIVEKVTFDGMVFVVATYPYKTSYNRGYLMRLEEGKTSLFAKKNITFRGAKPPAALESEPTPARYARLSDTYFLLKEDGEFKKINNAKDIMALMPEQASQMKKYMKSEKLSSKKIDDLVKLVSFANTIL